MCSFLFAFRRSECNSFVNLSAMPHIYLMENEGQVQKQRSLAENDMSHEKLTVIVLHNGHIISQEHRAPQQTVITIYLPRRHVLSPWLSACHLPGILVSSTVYKPRILVPQPVCHPPRFLP